MHIFLCYDDTDHAERLGKKTLRADQLLKRINFLLKRVDLHNAAIKLVMMYGCSVYGLAVVNII